MIARAFMNEKLKTHLIWKLETTGFPPREKIAAQIIQFYILEMVHGVSDNRLSRSTLPAPPMPAATSFSHTRHFEIKWVLAIGCFSQSIFAS